MSNRHVLKTEQPYFDLVWSRQKTFEVRRNDRDFMPGDLVELCEFDADTRLFGDRIIHATVGFVLHDFPGLSDGYCVMQLTEFVNQTKAGA